eukprot:Plantae.Rhodophyta-Rhodochaete_pulchella.ctg10245.p3 GENE.Plantae.Rhodophyta-Rhodochaete_pulchella.ctg10245~~Plantae.Rhodophyta-Rhodochaete_pulchella.ctg10245.p3  ORF type:complete len:138 (+),score=4.84 Plantae.Rhodophyta-Rhodochaete_pulchella.ctg10245:826-1239(+)
MCPKGQTLLEYFTKLVRLPPIGSRPDGLEELGGALYNDLWWGNNGFGICGFCEAHKEDLVPSNASFGRTISHLGHTRSPALARQDGPANRSEIGAIRLCSVDGPPGASSHRRHGDIRYYSMRTERIYVSNKRCIGGS